MALQPPPQVVCEPEETCECDGEQHPGSASKSRLSEKALESNY